MYPEALLKNTEQLVQQLNAASKSITVAESCTGGLLGGLITSVSGASEVFAQGAITYSNEAKTNLLGVDKELFTVHGAVSAEVAEAMAAGALRNSQADIALSITGIAGPSGGTEGKPVGLVYIGCAQANPSPHRGEARRGAREACSYPIDRTLANARDLRKNMTDAEKILWHSLRGKQLGVKFRKQHPIGQYITDFACLDPMLIIELDGGQHNEDPAQEYDSNRTEFLRSQGFEVLRFWNNDINDNLEGVLETINNKIHSVERPHPNPPPDGEGIIATSTQNLFDGDRQQVRLQSCAKAIEIALASIRK